MSNTSTVEQINSALRAEGYGSYVSQYAHRVSAAAASIDAGTDPYEAMKAEAGNVVGDSVLRRFASRVEVEAPAATEDETVTYLTEAQIDAIVTAASEHADRDMVVGILTNAGLVEPTPEPEVEEKTEGTEVEGLLVSIKGTLDSLVAFARRHGFNG